MDTNIEAQEVDIQQAKVFSQEILDQFRDEEGAIMPNSIKVSAPMVGIQSID